MGPYQAAVAFLVAEYILVLMVLFKKLNLLADIFKTSQMYSRISIPDIFPVKPTYSPVRESFA